MKRVIYKKGASRVRQAAVEQLRQTREKISADNPGLLESIRKKIHQNIDINGFSGDLSIDKRKNLHTVMQFLEIKRGSPAFQSKVKQLLSE